jgi:hypothetical protein
LQSPSVPQPLPCPGYFNPEDKRQHVPLNYWYSPRRLHGITTLKTTICTNSGMKISVTYKRGINNWSLYYEAVLERLTCGQIIVGKIRSNFVKEVIKKRVS